MQIVPTRRKDRIMIRVFEKSMALAQLIELFNAREVKPGRREFPLLMSVPVPPPKTKAMHARTLRGKLKILTGTILWKEGEVS
jgi:hypothetical protein